MSERKLPRLTIPDHPRAVASAERGWEAYERANRARDAELEAPAPKAAPPEPSAPPKAPPRVEPLPQAELDRLHDTAVRSPDASARARAIATLAEQAAAGNKRTDPLDAIERHAERGPAAREPVDLSDAADRKSRGLRLVVDNTPADDFLEAIDRRSRDTDPSGPNAA